MKATSVLRWSIALQWMFIVITLLAAHLTSSDLPEQLQAYMEAEQALGLTSLLKVPLLAVIVMFIVADIGLLLLKKWAAWLFLLSNVYLLIYSIFSGPVVMHAYTSVASGIVQALIGATLAISFFTDALKTKNQSAESENQL